MRSTMPIDVLKTYEAIVMASSPNSGSNPRLIDKNARKRGLC
jgi:hypothetical protein